MTNTLTFDQKYAVLGTKDKSYEGVFITAVKTTGIFCRPSCRARRPNPENVLFYNSVTEALQNGYRACKVCKPLEQIDTTPEYIQSIINKLIENPQLKISDQDLVDQNIQPHNIRRWFQSNYNLTFHAFQRMLRINDAFTKVKSGQSITEAAFQSGYESLSGFNDGFASIFGKSASNIKDQKVIYITRITTPIGAMFGCATENGLCLLEFTDRKTLEAQFEDLKKQHKAVILPGKSKHLDQTKQELEEYFAGKRIEFNVPLDPLGTEFRQSVWQSLINIPYGQTRTYKEQSNDMNRPKAIRAIASANGANKIAIIIPCHRVIGSDGSLTGYAGGIHRKKWLLEHEGSPLRPPSPFPERALFSPLQIWRGVPEGWGEDHKTIIIPTPSIFSFKQCLWLLDRGLNDCLYHLGPNSVSKIIRVSSGIAFIEVTQIKDELNVNISKTLLTTQDIDEVVLYINSWFDLERDIQPFYDLLDQHSLLNHFPTQFVGTRIVGIPDMFEAICWCIIGQQINLKFAHRMKRNLVESYGEKRVINDKKHYLFPTPQTILDISREELAQMKFSRQKINYLYNISEAFINGTISKSGLLQLQSKEERIKKLTSIKGIGIWTANYVSMKTLGDMSCITYGDTGISKAIHTIFGTEKKPSKQQIDDIFSDFEGWESYLNIYLWRSLGE